MNGKDLFFGGYFTPYTINFFDSVINLDIEKDPYVNNNTNESFFLSKRKGYNLLENFGKDIKVIDVLEVFDKKKSNDGFLYFLIENNKKERKVVFYEIKDGIIINYLLNNGSEWLYCDDNVFNKMTNVLFPSGIYKKIDNVVVSNTDRNIAVIKKDLYFKDNIDIHIGDYIIVEDKTNRISNQFRKIIKITDSEIYLDTPFLNIKTNENVSCDIYIGKQLEESVLFFSSFGTYIVNGKNKTPTYKLNGFFDTYSKNIVSATVCDNTLFLLDSSGFLSYGGEGTNIFYENADNYIYVGSDKHTIINYRNNIIVMGNNKSSVGQISKKEFKVNITMVEQFENFGMYKKGLYCFFMDNLYIISQNKRLCLLEMDRTLSEYSLSIKDDSGLLDPKLSSILQDDEISIGTKDENLIIFVRTFKDIKNKKIKKTRIMKFDVYRKIVLEDIIEGKYLYGYNSLVYFGDNGVYGRGGNYDNLLDDVSNKINYQGIESILGMYIISGKNNEYTKEGLNYFSLGSLKGTEIIFGPGLFNDDTVLDLLLRRSGYNCKHIERGNFSSNIGIKDINNIYNSGIEKKCDIVGYLEKEYDEGFKDGINTISEQPVPINKFKNFGISYLYDNNFQKDISLYNKEQDILSKTNIVHLNNFPNDYFNQIYISLKIGEKSFGRIGGIRNLISIINSYDMVNLFNNKTQEF